MRFKVQNDTKIICEGCQGTTICTTEHVYNTADLTCNCEVDENLIQMSDIEEAEQDAADLEEDEEMAYKLHEKQGQLFDAPENVIEDEEIGEHEARLHLESLGWQELLKSAKNNGVKKPVKCKAPELIELILKEVYHGES